MRCSITRCRKLSDTWYIPKYSKIYYGWEKQGKGPEGATGHLTACSGSLKSPDSLDLTPIVRFWIWFFSASLFLKARRIISPLSLALWRSQDGSVQCWPQLHPVRSDTNSTGPTSVPLRLHPPPQPSTPIIFPGKQPEITHRGLQFEGFIETAAPVIIFQRLWISAGNEEPCRAEGKQVWLCLCDELNSG